MSRKQDSGIPCGMKGYPTNRIVIDDEQFLANTIEEQAVAVGASRTQVYREFSKNCKSQNVAVKTFSYHSIDKQFLLFSASVPCGASAMRLN